MAASAGDARGGSAPARCGLEGVPARPGGLLRVERACRSAGVAGPGRLAGCVCAWSGGGGARVPAPVFEELGDVVHGAEELDLGVDGGAAAVGWAAWRGPVFILPEPGPFPDSLPPNSACTFQCTELSGDLCRVRDGVRVDPVMARRADDERLAPHSCHEGCPRGLARSGPAEVREPGDLVDCHRCAVLA